MSKGNSKLTITLTGRQPVKITREEWPVIASAEHEDLWPDRKESWKLIVRQHSDGRTIIYAIFGLQFQGETRSDLRGGEMITVTNSTAESAGDTTPILDAIFRVSSAMEVRAILIPVPEGAVRSVGTFPRLAHECVADLLEVEI